MTKGTAFAAGATPAAFYKDVKNFQTSSGTQVHLHESEQVLGGVAHEL